MPLGLIALAAGGFGIGLTEFVILGFLPEVATDFNVSIPVAGYLVCPLMRSALPSAEFLSQPSLQGGTPKAPLPG
jgi:DHA1 family inner membrane transport protein